MKQVIAVLANDLHVSKDNISEFNKNWDELLDVCAKTNYCWDIVIGGDLWESRPGQTLNTFLAVKQAILKATQKYDFSLTIAEGNHCKVNQEEIEGWSHIFSEYKNVEVVDVFKLMRWEGTKQCLGVMSYFPEQGSFVQHLEDFKAHIKKVNVSLSDVTLYIHQGIAGGIGGYVADTDLPTELFDEFKQVLVGHYHNRIRIPDTSIYYIGSSRQKDFGEDEAKGYTLFYDDGSFEFVENKVNIRYKNIEVTAKELADMDVAELSDPNYRVKLKVKCDAKDKKKVDRSTLLEMGFNRVEIVESKKKEVTQQSSIDEKYDTNTIKKEYVDFCSKENIDPELGNSYLNKIK